MPVSAVYREEPLADAAVAAYRGERNLCGDNPEFRRGE